MTYNVFGGTLSLTQLQLQLDPLRSQSLFQLVQISDEYFEHLLLQYSLHSVINWIQTCRIWRPQLKWNKFWSFFL